MDPFVWRPGQNYDPQAAARIRQHFNKPTAVMGEAWFMGERQFFTELSGSVDQLSIQYLGDVLQNISSGTHSFGPREEWNLWFDYLLGQLIPRAGEQSSHYLLESLITAFIARYPDGVKHPPYAGFLHDVLGTLGRCLMDPAFERVWDLEKWRKLRYRDGWAQVGPEPEFSATLFFCMKYLPEKELEPWLKSIFEIQRPLWHSQTMGWFVGFHGFLTGATTHISDLGGQWPSVEWDYSHVLRGSEPIDANGPQPRPPFLSTERITMINSVLKEKLNPLISARWDASFDEFSQAGIGVEMVDIQDRFCQMYLAR